MAYSNGEKAMALTLWLSGKSYREIEEVTGITTNTLMNWNEAYGWDKQKEEHLKRLNEIAVESITDFKHKMLLRLEDLSYELFNDLKMAKSATKDKIVSNILDIYKQMSILKGVPTDISKVSQHVEVKPVKLEDYFK